MRFEVIDKNTKNGTKTTVICGSDFYVNTIKSNPDYKVVSCKLIDVSKPF
jgi:hypothetical protein